MKFVNNFFKINISLLKNCVIIYFAVKNEPTRFLGEGVSFKAKLIGILEVSEARGDRMCQAALADLKMAIRAAGEHKQRIAVQVSIDGLRLRDEKSGVNDLRKYNNWNEYSTFERNVYNVYITI